jgi:hypothetical protein
MIVKKSATAVGMAGPTIGDLLFAGGSTAVFLVILANLGAAMSLYFR